MAVFQEDLAVARARVFSRVREQLTPEQIAEIAEFFSFGINDLTQFTFGYSRDDA